jgi:RNA polymerase sigma-70 factor, ECF subfamily
VTCVEWMTTTQVLEDLRGDGESPAWSEFDRHFRKVVVGFALASGLSRQDAEDAAQETMLAFVKSFREGKYDRERGRLRDWLFGVARRVVLNLRSKRPLEHLIADKTTGTSFWDLVKDDKGVEELWQAEWRNMVLGQCMEQARAESDPKIFQAFEMYGLREMPVERVAEELGMSRNAVYIAKSRILSRLRELEKGFE